MNFALIRSSTLAAGLAFLLICLPAWSRPDSVFLEDLTLTELRDDLHAGKTTIIIPAGGTEQSGPHLALGKHTVRARLLSARIAQVLGDTVVAPVGAYVPEEGAPQRFPGTISVPAATFKNVIEAAARSLRQAGFTHI